MVGSYSNELRTHLEAYKKRRLGVDASGRWRKKTYEHILPPSLRMLNILEPIRAEVSEYLASRKSVQLHRDFAHLNSSQAMCFNLFFPLLARWRTRLAPGMTGLPFDPSRVADWQFEHIRDPTEGTNFDAYVRTKEGTEHLFEVKLSESEFGKAENDSHHRKKLDSIYQPRLRGKIDPAFLKPNRFFTHYQLLRNIAYVEPDLGVGVTFILPQANPRLRPALERVLAALSPDVARFTRVIHLEELVERLRKVRHLHLASYFDCFGEKYTPFG